LLLLATSWFLLEWLRGHILTGFPWHSIGYIWTGDSLLHGAVAQGAALFGVYGLGFLTLLLAGLPALLSGGQWRRPTGGALITVIPLSALLLIGWGAWRAQQIADDSLASDSLASNSPEIPLRIVQPNIAQQEKWIPGNRVAHFEKLLQLSQRPAATRPQIIIWPEAATPFFLAEQPEALRLIGQLLPQDGLLITGSPRLSVRSAETTPGDMSGAPVHNSILFIDSSGQIQASYDKFHLVPFGEYLPFRSLLSAIGLRKLTKDIGAFAPGPGPQTVRLNNLPAVSPLICYEIIFPAAVTDQTQRPGWIVNLTNDAWFGDTSGPPQHLAQARMRAIEEGIPVIRSANNGISAVISPSGIVLHALPLNQTGIIETMLPKPVTRPLYAQYQDMPLLLLSFLVLIFFTILRIREKHFPNMHA
ncbi:MAG TPA: apolipoprotein N-acyltransferase, partial [Alphaproteobacteria bacterium]|nr:apolipoprotein N-acyltransferase [Alphaproteobacteria bacterium]